jgi:hypothetical protein
LQSSGTLADLSLEGILETVQKDRSTGTLHLRSGDGEATLYFLFGHLFHATDSGEQQGEPVVHRALDWSTGDFTFDAKAKLPAEETIKGSTAELLANRARSTSNGTATPPTGEAAAAETTPEPTAEAEAGPEPEAGVMPAQGETAAVEPAAEPAAAPSAGEADEPRRRRTDQRPGTRPPETMLLYPVPAGKALHEGLTAGFVDFPKLLRSLAKDEHSGYVRLHGGDFLGVLLFSSGAVVEAIFEGDGRVSTGADAFTTFDQRIDRGEGGLDVIQLSPEMVTGIYQLLTSPTIYEKLLARFIKADALLEYLAEQGTSGAVIVKGSDGKTGIVLYREGKLLGAYTGDAREAADRADKVVALCQEPSAEIEVRGGTVPATLPVLESAAGAGPSQVPSGSTASPAVSEPPADAQVADEPGETEAAEAVVHEDSSSEAEEEEQDGGGGEVNWASAISEMAGRADAVLGTRSKKVKELLFASSHDREAVDATIEKVAELSIMFVDPSKLSSLAEEFRQIAAQAG